MLAISAVDPALKRVSVGIPSPRIAEGQALRTAQETIGVNRRDFLKASSALAAALGMKMAGLVALQREALGLETDDGGTPVVWLQGQSCTGCSVSLLNSIYYHTIEDLALNTLDIDFHPQLSSAAGNLAVSAAEKAYRRGGYVLVVEGAVPTAAGGRYCTLWPGLTALDGVLRYAGRAALVLAVGTCASYGGMAAGAPNPTGAKGVGDVLNRTGIVNIPGCPAHPDWIVGTVAYVLANNQPPALDGRGRPRIFYGDNVHEKCPLRERDEADRLGDPGCLEELGCRGPRTWCDCPTRHWNAAGKGQVGINWCIGAGCPCHGCTEPGFPDGMSPFYRLEGESDDD
jgi:hydrogenase small subunit